MFLFLITLNLLKKKNKDVMIAYKSDNKNFYVFKGDSDLDRPALL